MLSKIEATTFKSQNNTQIPGAKVTLIEHATHDFEEGNSIMLSEVKGMISKEDKSSSINSMSFKVEEVINRNSFIINCDTTLFTDYQVNGVAKQIKTPTIVKFSPLSEILSDLSGKKFDQDLINMDFEKMANFMHSSICFKLYGENLSDDSLMQCQAPEVQ